MKKSAKIEKGEANAPGCAETQCRGGLFKESAGSLQSEAAPFHPVPRKGGVFAGQITEFEDCWVPGDETDLFTD